MTNLLTDPPSRFAEPENLRRVLGLRNVTVFEALMSSPRLVARIDQKIEAQFGSPAGLPEEVKRTAETLAMLSQEEFKKTAKLVGVLAQARKIKRTVCGQQLGEVIKFCGSKDILRFIRDNDVPAFPGIRPCTALDSSSLEASAKLAAAFLFGLMPRSFQIRLVLAREPNDLSGALECPTQEGRVALTALLDAATSFLRSQDGIVGTT
jgi:hypothetical protein